MTQEKGIPYQRHKPSATLRSFLDPLDPGAYFDCGRARLHGLDDALLREAKSRGRQVGNDSFQLVATDMGLIFCRPSISFAIAARWEEVMLIRPHGEDPVVLPVTWPTHGELRFTVSKRLAANIFRRWLQLRMQTARLAKAEQAARFSTPDPASRSEVQSSAGDDRSTETSAETKRPGEADDEHPSSQYGGKGSGSGDAESNLSADRVEPEAEDKDKDKDKVGTADEYDRALISETTAADARSGDEPPPDTTTSSKDGPTGSPAVPESAESVSEVASETAVDRAPEPPQASNELSGEGSEPAGALGVFAKPVLGDPVADRPTVADRRPSGDGPTKVMPEPGPAPLAGPGDLGRVEQVSVQQDPGRHGEAALAPSRSQFDWPTAEEEANAAAATALPGGDMVRDVGSGGAAPNPEVVEPILEPDGRPFELAETVHFERDEQDIPPPTGAAIPRRRPQSAQPEITPASWVGSPGSLLVTMAAVTTFILLSTLAIASFRRGVDAAETGLPTSAGLGDDGAGSSRPTIDHQRFRPSTSEPLQSEAITSDPAAPSATSDAGQPEEGGDGGGATPTPQTTVAPETANRPRLCNSNYSGCVADVSDVDCPGDGDGPVFAEEQVVVMGEDVYGLDTDGDGETCEPDQPPSTEQVANPLIAPLPEESNG